MSKLSRALRSSALLITLAAAATAASALTKTNTFTVQAQIVADCTISASNLDFGNNLGLLATDTDATSTLTAVCTGSTTYNLGLSAGGVSGSTIPARLLSSGGATLPFNLYRDSNRTLVWGETVSTDTVSGTGNGQIQTYTVYGRVPQQVTAPQTGVYTSTITVTVTY